MKRQSDGGFMRLMTYLATLGKATILVLAFMLIAVLGLLDYATGTELASSLFYLLPVGLVAWFVGRKAGVVISVASAAVWFFANILGGEVFSSPLIGVWNTMVRLTFFLLGVFLLVGLRDVINREAKLARIDFLTGAANTRSFYEALQQEMRLVERYSQPFSVAYVDLDNFKALNDKLGHSAGDDMLLQVAQTLQSAVRKSDVVGRLGGDEFAVLFPKAGREEVQRAVEKIQALLSQVMHDSHWPVSTSIGVLICTSPTQDLDAVIRQADRLMYAVKRDGGNAVRYEVFAPA